MEEFKVGFSFCLPWVPEVFSHVRRELRFVSRRLASVRPKARETSGETARKNLWRRAP